LFGDAERRDLTTNDGTARLEVRFSDGRQGY